MNPALRTPVYFWGSVILLLTGIGAGILLNEPLWCLAPFALILSILLWERPERSLLLLLFSIPFSTEYLFHERLGTDLPDEPLMLITSFIFLAVWAHRPERLDRKTLTDPLLLLIGAVLAWSLITVLFSSHPVVSWKYLLAKSWYLGGFVLAPLLCLNDRKSFERLFIPLLSAILIVTGIALLRHALSGFRFAAINDAVSPFFRNHVNYAALLVVAVPMLWAVHRAASHPGVRHLAVAGTIIVAVALYFSYSRGAWLAVVLGIIAGWLLQKKWLVHAYAILVLLAFAAVFWLSRNDRYLNYAHDYRTTIFHENFREHWIATYRLRDVSTAERFYRWIAGIRMIADRPLTGSGPATFSETYKGYTVPAYKTWVSENEDRSTVHNYPLLVATEQGLPGLALLLVCWGMLLYRAQRSFHRAQDRFGRTVSMATGMTLVMVFTVNCLSDLIETDKIGSIFFLCLAILVAIERRQPSESSAHM